MSEDKSYTGLISFAEEHYNDDICSLLLSAGRYPGIDIGMVANMVAARRKIDAKVPSWREIRTLYFPDPVAAEQSSSEITAMYKRSFVEGGGVLDLTGGLGVDSYFLSGVASHLWYYEKNPLLFRAAEHNFGVLGVKNITAGNKETGYGNIPEVAAQGADLIYMDPSRRSDSGKRVFSLSEYSPDVLLVKSSLLKLCKRLLVKISPMADISAIVDLMPETSQVHIVSVNNECKELLFLLTSDRVACPGIDSPGIFMLNFTKKGVEKFFSTLGAEKSCEQNILQGSPETYLYEPNSSILKGGAFKSTGASFNLKKLAVNTHLYTCSSRIEGFPGKVFLIKRVHNAGKKGIKEIHESIPYANISVRNFPLSASTLREQLRIKDGGDVYLFGTTLSKGERCILECILIS